MLNLLRRSVVGVVVSAIVTLAETPPARTWLGADGKPVPWDSDDEILEFLATARVVSETPISTGINESKKLVLERDGVEMHAIFREVDVEWRFATVGERRFRLFRDSHRYECAAYQLARLLGLHNVPPAVPRTIGRRRGSVQIWMEVTIDETSEGFDPPSVGEWSNQLWRMYFFDNLVFNVDRNAGNVLVDRDYRLWMIDHTRAFQTVSELLDDWVMRVDRRLWQRLVALSDDDIRGALAFHLDAAEIDSLLERRRALVEHVVELVERRGEAVVFY